MENVLGHDVGGGLVAVLENTVQHRSALRASSGQLCVRLRLRIFELIELVSNVKGRKDGNFERIDGQRAG